VSHTMQIPAYLSLSRHHIYYFRWPIPAILGISKPSHIRLSLGTRCPREALRLARIMEYTGIILSTSPHWITMDHADIVSVLRGHFAQALEAAKARLAKSGPLPVQNILNIQSQLKFIEQAIADNRADPLEELFSGDPVPEELSINVPLTKILKKFDLPIEPGSFDHETFRQEYKFALRNYFQDLLRLSTEIRDYTHLGSDQNVHPQGKRPELRLKNISEKFIEENKRTGSWSVRALEERIDCLNYLQEVVGPDFDFASFDNDTARFVKDTLLKTPKNRNKMLATRGLPLTEQIKIAGVECLAVGSINKYIQVFSALCSWGMRNKYLPSNPFESLKLADTKKSKRSAFTKAQIAKMLNEASKKGQGLCNTDLTYWGALIAIFTGARLNEIASLTPTDVKLDGPSNIYYFEITDDEEANKKIKTDAARRIVPVHPFLIELGLLAFVEKRKNENLISGYSRLIPGLTLSEKEGWGRKLGRWFNEQFLPKLALKTKMHTLHSLRHSFITSLSIAGVDSATIKSMVGHEQDTVTAGVYTHFGVDHLPQFFKAITNLDYTSS